jgi:hypothetical protein
MSAHCTGGRGHERECFTEERIIGVLKEVDAGPKVIDVCRNTTSVM